MYICKQPHVISYNVRHRYALRGISKYVVLYETFTNVNCEYCFYTAIRYI